MIESLLSGQGQVRNSGKGGSGGAPPGKAAGAEVQTL